MSLKLPMSWLAGMSQTRKAGWDLLWCAQHESRVDRAIRDVTSWMWLCGAWGEWDGHPILFSRRSWEPEFFRRPDRQQTRSFNFFDRRVAEAYNTWESLTQADHTRDPKDVYANARRGGSVLDGVIEGA